MDAILDILASGLGILRTWFGRKNAPDEVAAKEAQNQEDTKAKVDGDIVSGDPKRIEGDLS